MASIKLDAAARPLSFSSGENLERPPELGSDARSEASTAKSDGSAGSPTIPQLISRSGLPLMMIVIVAGTPLWGGYVTLLLAFALWRIAGVAL